MPHPSYFWKFFMPAVLYLFALAVFAQGTSEFVLAGLLPAVGADLDIPTSRAGLLTSAFAVGMVIGAPAMAVASRRLPPRVSLSGFLATFVAAHAIGAMTDSFGVLLISRVIAAGANAGFLAVTLATVSRIVPADRSVRALSVVLGGTTLALIAGVPAGAYVGELLGWRATLWTIAALCVPSLVSVAALTPGSAERTTVSGPGTIRRELRVLRRGPVLTDAVLAVLVNAATFCAFTYLAVIASGPAQIDASKIPLLLAIFGAGAFVGVTAAGRYADYRWRQVIALTAPLLCVGWVLLALFVAVPAALWNLAFAQGGLSFALGSTLISRIVVLATEAPTFGGAVATVALNVGAAIGPIAGGLALDTLGVRGPVVVSSGLVLVAIGVRSIAVKVLSHRQPSSLDGGHDERCA